MLSVESGGDSAADAWAPVLEEKVVVPAATAPAPAPVLAPAHVETDDMDEEALLDIIASEGIAGLGNDDERKQFNKLLLDNVSLHEIVLTSIAVLTSDLTAVKRLHPRTFSQGLNPILLAQRV